MPRPTDPDIYRSAAALIEHHGDHALLEATTRADAVLAKGDFDGWRVWLSIARGRPRSPTNKALCERRIELSHVRLYPT